MLIIGICGTSGSGKGYISKKFTKYNVAHIDTDRVYREISSRSQGMLWELTEFFGSKAVENGKINRKALAPLVFEGKDAPKRLKKLNEITHKYIKIDTERLIAEYELQGYSAVLVDAPVLFESGFDKMCHATICVTAPYEMKVARIMERDGISREKAEARLSTQLTNKELRERCTYEIDNTDGVDIDGQIISILKDLNIEA